MTKYHLSYSRYVLDPLLSAFSKEGFLLKACDHYGNIKYADCSPWPSLGDEDLTSHVEQLTKLGQPSSLVLNAILNAPNWSSVGYEMLALDQPPSHTLVTHIPMSLEQITSRMTLKVKIGRSPQNEIDWLIKVNEKYPLVRWRLDANALFTNSQWKSFWSQLPAQVQAQVDYVEDPFEYQAKLWADWNQQVPLALDFATKPHLADPDSYQIYVFKPSRQSKQILSSIKHKPIAITSQLGHAIDCLNSLYFYQQLLAQGYQLLSMVGCLNQNIYDDPFYQVMQINQGYWSNLSQSLVVWDDYLKHKINWIEIGEFKI